MMKEIDQLKRENPDLITAVTNYVDILVNEKKLKIPTGLYKDTCLQHNNYIKKQGDSYSITNFPIIAYFFFEKYKLSQKFEIVENFKHNSDFLKKIDEDFNSSGYVEEYHSIEKELWNIIIVEANQNFKCYFDSYLRTLNKEEEQNELFNFVDSYSNKLKDLNIPVETIYSNSIQLWEFTKSEETYNIPLGNVLNGIKQKCMSDFSDGLELFKISISQETPNNIIISAITSGLYELKGIEFYHSYLQKEFENEKVIQGFLSGLSHLNSIQEAECILFISLYDKFKENNDLIFPLIQMLILIIKFNKTNVEHYEKECFIRLKEAIKKEKMVYFILHQITFIEDHKDEKVTLIIDLINQEFFDINKYLSQIAHLLYRLEDSASFKKIILTLVNNRPFQSFAKNLHPIFSIWDKRSLDELLIVLLTDNNAKNRFSGLDIFSELSLHNPYKFTLSILELEPIIQYKLWVALTQDFKEPKYFIPALLPLLDSKSEIIKDSFIYKLEEYSEDYGEHIIDILKNHLDTSNKEYIAIIERIKSYMNTFFSENINIKQHLKELNPYYTSYSKLKKFNEQFFTRMRRSINKGAEEHSFLSIIGANTVKLAKGGGWKYGEKEISKLETIGTTFSLPRSFFIHPDKYEIEKSIEMKRDWSEEEFIDTAKALKNEQQ